MPDQSFDGIDAGTAFDWGRTSQDYDRYRPGPPDSFYRLLAAHGIGLPGQDILDLGTGTGLLARRFATAGANATGVDISASQIEMARAAALREGVAVKFVSSPADDTGLPDDAFDVVTANQCWIYFDTKQVLREVRRLLRPDGRLLVSHFSFMPRMDPLVAASEALVLKYSPDWSGADWDGVIPAEPRWARGELDLIGLFVYDEQIPFTHDSWRGRMRALRGIAASLDEAEVRAFDTEHAALLRESVPDEFTVRHRIHAQIFAPAQA